MCLQVTGSSVQLVAEVRGLKVIPQEQADAATSLRYDMQHSL